jgi:hypothetical protein
MRSTSRWALCLACALVGALEAPRALHVLSEDLRGPYPRGTPASIGAARSVAGRNDAVGRERAEGNKDALHGSPAVVNVPHRL